MEGGQGLRGVLRSGSLGACPAEERGAIGHQLGPLGAERIGRGLRGLESLGAVEGAPLHRLVFGTDQPGAAAGQPLQQAHGPIRHLSIEGHGLTHPGQLIGRGAQHGPAALRQGGSGGQQQVLASLGPFIEHQHPTAPAVPTDPQAGIRAPRIPAAGRPLQSFIRSRGRAPGHPHPLGRGLPQGPAVGGHQDGHPIGGEGREGGGDGLGFAAAHRGLHHQQGGGLGAGEGCPIGQPSARGGGLIGHPRQGGQHRISSQGPQGRGQGLPAATRG